MRSRFFRILVVVLFVTAIGATALHAMFLKQERLRLIDQQVRETATALLDSELGDRQKIDFERADEIISEELGESRIGKFFTIRNDTGDIIFQSTGARVLPVTDVPQHPQWVTIDGKGQYIRVLNLRLPRVPNRTLQVGYVIEEELLAPSYFSAGSLTLVSTVLLLGLFVSWFLTSTLLRPISVLADFVESAATDAARAKELPSLPSELATPKTMRQKKDELKKLLAGLDVLMERINSGYRMSRFWSYQMAHEMKTPMAIMKAEVDSARTEGRIDDETAASISAEIIKVSDTISSFLMWAEIENSEEPKRVFAIRASKLLTDLVRRLSMANPNRVTMEVIEDFHIFADPQQVEQFFMNILGNAIAYSPHETVVRVTIAKTAVVVTDAGPGISKSVQDRMGEPFNRGEHSKDKGKSHGLGLAFVHSLARMYAWDLMIETGENGTTIQTRFEPCVLDDRAPSSDAPKTKSPRG